MDREPRQIEVVFGPGGARLGQRGFPHVALVDPDIPEKFDHLAKYMNYGKTLMRATVGNMWAIYGLTGVTFAGDQMWTLLATRHTGSQKVQFSHEASSEELRKQIEEWLLPNATA